MVKVMQNYINTLLLHTEHYEAFLRRTLILFLKHIWYYSWAYPHTDGNSKLNRSMTISIDEEKVSHVVAYGIKHQGIIFRADFD